MASIRIVQSVLVICFGMCFLKATAGGSCTATFPSEDDIHNTSQGAVVPERIQNNLLIQWVFPSMTFGCDGRITRWIFQAQKNRNSDIQILPRFQLWRNRSVTPNYSNFLLELVSTSGSEEELSGGEGPVYEYIMQSQLEVRVGYVFGIHLLQSSIERLQMKFLDMGEGGTPSISYLRDFNGITFDIRSSPFDDQRYVPMVAAEISLSSSMTTTALLSPTTPTASNPTLKITPGSTTAVVFPSPPLQATGTPMPETTAGLSATSITIGTTVGGGLSILIMVIVLTVLLTRYIQTKRKRSDSDTQTSADLIQTVPNEAYETNHTSQNIAYGLTVPPRNKDNSYSYPLAMAVHEEIRYSQFTESRGTYQYHYCRPTC